MERASHLHAVSVVKQAALMQETLEQSQGKFLATLLTGIAHRSRKLGK